jgi:hypothetical protein
VIDRSVLITGLMRSGTSLVASMCHRLGFMVGPQIPVPIPPRWRSDWEPLELTRGLVNHRGDALHDWLVWYCHGLREQSRLVGFEGRICLKSPFLAPRWDIVRQAIPDAFVVRTFRYSEDVERSMAAHPALSAADQVKIAAGLRNVRPDCEIGYEAVCDNPVMYASILAKHLGNDSQADIEAAAALVGRQTVYSPADADRS